MKKSILVGLIAGICIVGISLGILIPLSLLPPPTPNTPFEWETSTPEEQGMDANLPDDISFYIVSENDFNVSSVLIIRNGYIVVEAYYENYMKKVENSFTIGDWLTYQSEGELHNIYSATKSITALLVGIAIDKGFIDNISQTIFDFFPELWNETFDPRKENITVENLLKMESGIPWISEVTESPYSSPPWVKASDLYLKDILEWALVYEPGESWDWADFYPHYSSDATHVLSSIITRSSGMNTSDFAQEYLFGPLGISRDDWYWHVDGDGVAHGGSALCMKPRDMARIGYLCLNNGSWDGEQVIPSDWIEKATTDDPAGTSPYGYQWYIGAEYYYASGHRGQSIYVIPDHNLVVVFTADGTGGSGSYSELINTIIIPAII